MLKFFGLFPENVAAETLTTRTRRDETRIVSRRETFNLCVESLLLDVCPSRTISKLTSVHINESIVYTFEQILN